MEETPLCFACRGIDIEQVSRPKWYLLHENVRELRQCPCVLCEEAYDIVLSIRIPPVAENGPWCRDEMQDQYLARVVRATYMGDPSLAIIIRHNADGRPCGVQREFDEERSWVRLYTMEADPAVSYGVDWVRPIPLNTSSLQTFKQAKTWIARCVDGTCQGAERMVRRELLAQSNERPSRLIELVDREKLGLRLIDGNTSMCPYVALSYTWGRTPALWKTTTRNLGARQDCFCAQDLPKTLQDAVVITRELGLSHIWVDSICIVQDDPEDWASEATRMSHIYRQAYVTVAAAASTGSTTGIFNNRSRHHLEAVERFKVTNRLSNDQSSALYLVPSILRGDVRKLKDMYQLVELESQWDNSVSRSRLSTRGWCCQERLLSPRVLHFATTQLFWECRHLIDSEDHFRSVDRNRGMREVLEVSRRETGPDLPKHTALQKSHSDLLRRWYHRVVADDYSPRHFTQAADKLIALAGLASAFQYTLRSRYIAGMWEEGLLAGLCWSRVDFGCKTSQYRAPSWSWASQDSAVQYRFQAFDRSITPYAKVLRAEVDLVTDNKYGSVSGGYLELQAPCICGKLGPSVAMSVDENVICIDDEEEVASVIFAEALVLDAILDSENVVKEDVFACTMLEYDFGGHGLLFLLLLQQTDDDSEQYERVGLAMIQRGKLSVEHAATLKAGPLQTVTIV